MTTWCSGIGKRWAERRTSLTGSLGARIEAVSLWVHLDPTTGRPAPWGQEFAGAYLEAANGREVSSRLVLPKKPPSPDESPNGPNVMAWQFRQSDLDIFNHVNNAAYLAVVEEALQGASPPAPLRLDIDWHRPTNAEARLRVVESFDERGRMTMWLLDGDTTCAVIAAGPSRSSSTIG